MCASQCVGALTSLVEIDLHAGAIRFPWRRTKTDETEDAAQVGAFVPQQISEIDNEQRQQCIALPGQVPTFRAHMVSGNRQQPRVCDQ